MRSLRGRLTIGITLVLAVVLAGAGLVVSRYVEQSERAALDDRLESIVELSRETALSAVERELPSRDQRLDNVLSATGTSLRLLLDGRELPAFGRPPPPGRPTPRDGFQTFEAGGERFRAYTIRLEALGGLARLEVTTRLTPTERRLSELNRRLLAFGAAALLLAALGVWLAADVILRPLRRLRRATAGIAGTEDLDRRVPGDVGPAELRSLAASFNEMLARLGRSAADRERALAATRRFTADAGHELRTPLTSVQANLSALSRHPDMPAQQRAEMVEDALAENRRLVALLEGLQGLARGDAPPPLLDDVELADLVAVTVAAVQKHYPDVTWTCRLPDEPVVVRGWEPGLRIIVDNLVNNAARHGGGAVAVTLSADPASDGGPELSVEDDGGGVAAQERERIFEPFVRADGTSAPGSGLGLALVRQQVRAHGATVDVGGSPLGGARFVVRFGGGG
ncbi:MAG TPA: HAMP domain-containing sensor histidine kinase [Solirubrobacteraceae bacterium]|nr:HAMP domain-containing sensor histidine kinase [Solirubrobacteraceae bacterium]